MRPGFGMRSVLLGGGSFFAFTAQLLGPVLAQEAGAPEQVVVTGSRIQTGFATPTPVTVSTSDQLKEAAPLNVADALNQLPEFSGSTFATQGGGGNVTGQTNG